MSDALGAEARVAPLGWVGYGGRSAFHGVVSTVRCHEAVGLIRQCLDEPGRGRVLVVDAAGSLSAAMVGDKMAANALRRGWAGLIVHGAVRDVDALRGMDIGVFALGSVPRRGSFDMDGERDVSVTVGELLVRPGEHIFCDGDGVVVCSVEAARRVMSAQGFAGPG